MRDKKQSEWSEFDWEREIQKDEARIHGYLNELRNYIDLPNEEEMIMSKMQKHPELIPQNASRADKRLADFFEGYDEEFSSNGEWKSIDGGDIYTKISRLAYQWNTMLASRLSKANLAHGMRVTCLYGRMMARMADILDLSAENLPKLRLALCKRILADINTISGEFSALPSLQPDLATIAETHKSNLISIRNRIFDLLEKIKAQISGEKDGGKS